MAVEVKYRNFEGRSFVVHIDDAPQKLYARLGEETMQVLGASPRLWTIIELGRDNCTASMLQKENESDRVTVLVCRENEQISDLHLNLSADMVLALESVFPQMLAEAKAIKEKQLEAAR